MNIWSDKLEILHHINVFYTSIITIIPIGAINRIKHCHIVKNIGCICSVSLAMFAGSNQPAKIEKPNAPIGKMILVVSPTIASNSVYRLNSCIFFKVMRGKDRIDQVNTFPEKYFYI